jgi:hypothetical protein
MQTFVDDVDDVGSEEELSLDRSEMETIVSRFISAYFEDKDIPIGVDLFQNHYVDMVLDTNVCNGVDVAYAALARSGRFETTSSDHLISEDIRYVIKTLSQIRKMVPAEFAAGVLLMHIELVEGIPL